MLVWKCNHFTTNGFSCQFYGDPQVNVTLAISKTPSLSFPHMTVYLKTDVIFLFLVEFKVSISTVDFLACLDKLQPIMNITTDLPFLNIHQ